MFNLENIRLTLKSLFLDMLTLKKKLYFVDLVKTVNDQFNKNTA